MEAWVVHGIGKKLLDARINQLSRSVAVTRTTHCSFGTAQWQELSAQLSQWAVWLLVFACDAVIGCSDDHVCPDRWHMALTNSVIVLLACSLPLTTARYVRSFCRLKAPSSALQENVQAVRQLVAAQTSQSSLPRGLANGVAA